MRISDGSSAVCSSVLHPPRHRHHVGLSVGEDLLGDRRIVDAVGRAQRNADLAAHLLRDPCKCVARHRGRDGRDARLVPADAGVDDGRTGFLDRLRQFDDRSEEHTSELTSLMRLSYAVFCLTKTILYLPTMSHSTYYIIFHH